MHQRQGYLDSEDQKTLISFVLYGDPLALPGQFPRHPKIVMRPPTAELPKPVCRKATCSQKNRLANPPAPLPPEVQAEVKRIVTQYLPGMAGALMSMTQSEGACQGAHCPLAQKRAKAGPNDPPTWRVVTLSKCTDWGAQRHHHYARLTLDERGKLIKLAVSR
jgi:hypothetical protein